MKNLAFHNLLRLQLIMLPIRTTSPKYSSFKGLGECTFEITGVKLSGCTQLYIVEALARAKRGRRRKNTAQVQPRIHYRPTPHAACIALGKTESEYAQ